MFLELEPGDSSAFDAAGFEFRLEPLLADKADIMELGLAREVLMRAAMASSSCAAQSDVSISIAM